MLNHAGLMAAVDNWFIQATLSANSASQYGDGETFFWCQQPGSSTVNYDYCGNNGDCPVNGVNGVPCCYCGGYLITVCLEGDYEPQSIGANNNDTGSGIGPRTFFWRMIRIL